jgi:hypothetical protein
LFGATESDNTKIETTMSDNPTMWKHIGLHGHSVGTFILDDNGIQWKSALSDASSTTRSIPGDKIDAAYWTVFGKSGHLRIKTSGETKIHHELRFDGFAVGDFDSLRTELGHLYDVDLIKYNISAAGTQYGISKLTSKKLTFRHCILEDADEEGEVRCYFVCYFVCIFSKERERLKVSDLLITQRLMYAYLVPNNI